MMWRLSFENRIKERSYKRYFGTKRKGKKGPVSACVTDAIDVVLKGTYEESSKGVERNPN